MEKKQLAVCCVVGLLGLVAAATGFAAEATRTKASQIQYKGINSSDTECVYPRSPALALGLTAAMSLMLAQIIINVASGCLCCRPTPNSNANWTVLFVCFVVSWLLCIIAFLFLLTGAALNDQHNQGTMYFGNYYCYVVKPGVFLGGAFLAIVSVITGIAYYVILNTSKATGSSISVTHGGIAMGQPQFPPPQDPVFVHEDTYTRRQFN